ncbi:MAG: DUF2321 domain-containing protein [Bacteroidetes bacterium]|nr:DUF2321 domain-containing protein [Bacteroidota bacterium]
MEEGTYDIAQICLNRHIINKTYESIPKYSKEYCDRCGEKTINQCPNCKKSIRGFLWPGIATFEHQEYVLPLYCDACGDPFPWIETKINAAMELSKEAEILSEVESIELKESIHNIITDSPKTQLGAIKFKKIMIKLGRETATAVRDIIVDIASETAKKIIMDK